eukprot:jgi/Psemu1/192051/e_gw1.122.8.1
MKLPLFSMSSTMALRSLQATDPVLFEKSFQTLTASSLSWIDEELLKIDSNCTEHKLKSERLSSTPTEYDEVNSNHQVVAEAVIRRVAFKILDKYRDVSSPERVEQALKYHTLPESLQEELATKYGGSTPSTWFDALIQLEDFCRIDGGDKERTSFEREALWKLILDHPITAYVPVQCQSCGGYIVPDDNPCASTADDAKLGLREEEPTAEESPFVRIGWYRGPRLVPSVFVIDCPICGSSSRWFRSRDPKIILNPRRWGRLCGEQEDLRLDLARYFGSISIRTIGIGAWTKLLALSPDPEFCCDVTNSYVSCQYEGGRANNRYKQDMARYRQQITEAKKDGSGSLTQAGTVNGYAIQRAGLTSSEITSILQRAVEEYGTQAWYDVH